MKQSFIDFICNGHECKLFTVKQYHTSLDNIVFTCIALHKYKISLMHVQLLSEAC